MKPYSLDLRQRVAAALEHHEGSQRQLAARFRVSLSFITRLLRHRRATGTLTPKPHGGGRRPALDPAAQNRLRQLVRSQPDATLEELAARLGIGCSRMASDRLLRKLKITRKKKSLPRAATRSASGAAEAAPLSRPGRHSCAPVCDLCG